MRCLYCDTTNVSTHIVAEKLSCGVVDLAYCECRNCGREFIPKDMILENEKRVAYFKSPHKKKPLRRKAF